MIPVLHTQGLTKLYGQHPGLTEANLTIPAGRVVGLVGPNGAGKSTLLGLISGMHKPTHGTIHVLGNKPAANAHQLARVGFVAQDTPVYPTLTVADHLKLGAKLNKTWDHHLAQRRINQVGLNPNQKAGRLSGGQRAQLALALAAAKRPDLLIFDEPVAALDPLARRQFLQNLMEFVSELNVTVILSSHLLSDLERVCDYLILLAAAKVQLAGEVDDLLATHFRLTTTPHDLHHLPPQLDIITTHHTNRHTTLIARRTTTTPIPHTIHTERIDLEDMVLAYMTRATNPTPTHYQQQPYNTGWPHPMEAQR
jgi:ABC-2 type transport system ATP-binding protein